MNKPDDVSQEDWEQAFKVLDSENAFSDFYDSENDQSMHVSIARAIMAAGLQERDECAKVAEAIKDERKRFRDDEQVDSPEYAGLHAQFFISSCIAQAIRNRK